MKILSLTTLYPSSARPSHGIFVENRLREVAKRGHDIRVIAPVPRFPFKADLFGTYARYARTPAHETRHSIPISHPKYVVLPKIGMTAAMHTLAQCFKDAIAKEMESGFYPDLIDAHYYYPDGVAAHAAADHFGLPFTVTARGTDINLIPAYPKQKQMILEAANRAEASITVAEALRQEMIKLGCDGEKIMTLRNGVDLETFHQPAARANRHGLTLASVGHLIERKGHHLVIEALADLPDTKLLIAGRGPEDSALRSLAKDLGVADRVTFLGERPHDELTEVYGEADITVLASSREGWPNVLLESMASGTPCVATPVWGSGEVIAAPEAGMLAKDRTAPALAEAVKTLAGALPSRDETRRYAEKFGWAPIAEKVETVWEKAASAGWGHPSPLPETNGITPALFTVDTEEEFDWSGDHATWTVPEPACLEAIQRTAEGLGVKPLYFTTYPLLEDDEIGGRLSDWVASGKASCGIHLHTWSTPPNGQAVTPESTFQCNIDPDRHREKLKCLIDAYERRIGRRPIAHRAGRYGAAPWVLDQLADEGIMYDFSPSAGFDPRGGPGPDFSRFGNFPRRRETAKGPQWVFPVSGARKWRGTSFFTPPHGRIGRSVLNAARMAATVPVRLTPEGHTLEHITTLTSHLREKPGMVLTPSIHLTSIIPGATPYAAAQTDADRMLQVLEEWYRWGAEQGVRPITLEALTEQL